MLSVVIPYYEAPGMEWKRPILKERVKSFSGFCDELIVLSGTQSTLPKTINHGFELASGDFVVVSNDDCRLLSGSLRALCVPSTLTSPLINGQNMGYSGHIFCAPREVILATGGFDENYEIAYFDDDDFEFTTRDKGFEIRGIEEVNVYHPPHGTTLDRRADRQEIFEKNKEYFVNKWGRLP